MEAGDAICRVGSQSCEAIRRDFLHFLLSCRRWASSSHVLQSVSSLRIAWVPFIQDTPKIIVAGYGHFEFSDPIFREELSRLLVPSFANGYPHTLTHIYQCQECCTPWASGHRSRVRHVQRWHYYVYVADHRTTRYGLACHLLRYI